MRDGLVFTAVSDHWFDRESHRAGHLIFSFDKIHLESEGHLSHVSNGAPSTHRAKSSHWAQGDFEHLQAQTVAALVVNTST